jgi:hypothetical protein
MCEIDLCGILIFEHNKNMCDQSNDYIPNCKKKKRLSREDIMVVAHGIVTDICEEGNKRSKNMCLQWKKKGKSLLVIHLIYVVSPQPLLY